MHKNEIIMGRIDKLTHPNGACSGECTDMNNGAPWRLRQLTGDKDDNSMASSYAHTVSPLYLKILEFVHSVNWMGLSP